MASPRYALSIVGADVAPTVGGRGLRRCGQRAVSSGGQTRREKENATHWNGPRAPFRVVVHPVHTPTVFEMHLHQCATATSCGGRPLCGDSTAFRVRLTVGDGSSHSVVAGVQVAATNATHGALHCGVRGAAAAAAGRRPRYHRQRTHDHDHDAACGCGRQHKQASKAARRRDIISGFLPACIDFRLSKVNQRG